MPTNPTLNTLLRNLARTRRELESLREMVLANAVLFGEIPSPTFGEAARVRFMQDRFIEAGCQNVSTDEAGNAVGILPGHTGERNILLAAHMDTPFAHSVDHAVKVLPKVLQGPGIMDNSLGLAAVATLPAILDKLNLRHADNLLLLGTTRSLGRGNIEGIRFFLQRNPLPLRAAIFAEGGTLGRLSYTSLGVLRGVIEVTMPEDYDHLKAGATGAIPILNRLISRIQEIPLPGIPQTSIILGSVEAGTTYHIVARSAQLKFEVRSEGSGRITAILSDLEAIVDELNHSSGAGVSLEIVGRRQSGGLPFHHPLVRSARQIMEKLKVKPRVAPSTGELAAAIEQNIPGVTLGISEGSRRGQTDERVRIDPMFTGLTQIIGLIMAIDQGFCDVED